MNPVDSQAPAGAAADARPVCAVVGAGPGNGAAFARRFATAGHAVALLARDVGRLAELARGIPGSRAYGCDVTSPGTVAEAFARIGEELGPVDVLIYNAGKGVWGDALSITPEDFEHAWRVNTLGALLAVRAVLPDMRARGRGTIIFVGATASRRGGPRTAAFAPAKAAQRSLAESLAKAYGPDGIHVSLLIIDARVNDQTPAAAAPAGASPAGIEPDDVAATAVMLVHQPRSAWTFELDLRPCAEPW